MKSLGADYGPGPVMDKKKILIILHFNFFSCLQLLDDEVEIIPAVVCEEAGVEGEHDAREICLGVLEVEVLGLAAAELDQPGPDDDEEGEQLGVGEHVLHRRGPLHVPAVHKREHGCEQEKYLDYSQK